MARYDLYRLDEGYVVDVQSDLLSHLNSRVVVPLLPPDLAPVPGRRLNPIFSIDGASYVMVTQFMSAMMVADLPEVAGNFDKHHDEIVAAPDMLFQGF